MKDYAYLSYERGVVNKYIYTYIYISKDSTFLTSAILSFNSL